ncbi:MAG: hypothetical protein EPO08_19770 [Rhodospirillaceae bacterium]|nr:MAG: hypothetical protein EPO08_19770 [Rhodospirillaceae bacterium]
MVRLTISALGALCVALMSLPATAANFGAPGMSTAVVQTPSTSAARLYALGITTRAQASVGQGDTSQASFAPPMTTTAAPPISAATPVVCGSAAAGSSSSAVGITSAVTGMRFMPLHRDAASHTFAVPARREIVASAQALRAAVAGSKNESDLAQAALQAANAPSPQTQAQTELASLTGKTNAAASNPTAMANEEVLAQIQRYRNTHNAW